MKREIVEKATVKIGGLIVAKYKCYMDNLEVILIVRTGEIFFGVVTTGHTAHRAYYLNDGQIVEVEGSIVETTVPSEKGWKKVVYSILCDNLREGQCLTEPEDPFKEYSELSKMEIFSKIEALSRQNKAG